MVTMKDRIKAHHEAGHAVVARTLGIAVTYVTTLSTGSDNEGGAQTHSAAWRARDADLPARLVAIGKDIKVSMAGPQAEHRYRPIKHTKWSFLAENAEPYWWAGDFRGARNSACQVVLLKDRTIATTTFDAITVNLNMPQITEIDRLIDQFRKETEMLVHQYWPAIERTAKALLSGRPLVPDELDALIANRAVWPTLGVREPVGSARPVIR
jgi:hypothetical protein